VPARLHLYRFIEDAWSGGLRQWCEAAPESPATESWLLTDNPGQQRWLLRKFSEASIPPIRIHDPDSLRTELASRANLDPPQPLGPTASLSIKLATQGLGEPSRMAARNAPALAEACDTLARAGWHLNQLRLDPDIARRLHRTFDRSSILPGIFDRRLREALPPQPIRLCCIGWDATHWPDLALLDLAASIAQSFEIYVPAPRLPADAQQREWIESLEQRLSLERATCPESGFTSENDSLVARLENSQLAPPGEIVPPDLLVGREWPDQVALVCVQVLEWLADDPNPDAPIGIIAPPDSPTAIAVAETLQAGGIPIERPHRASEPSGPLPIIQQVARYHLGGHDIADLLELTRLLWLDGRMVWRVLEPESVRDTLDRAFQVAQSRNSRILARALPARKDPVWTTLCSLIDSLGRWAGDPVPLATILEKWVTLESALRLPGLATLRSGIITPPRLRAVFPAAAISPRTFMEWLAEESSPSNRPVPAPNYSTLAPIVITTHADAAQQTWSRLIFLDSNEHLWPAPFPENVFLPDSTRLRLNQTRHESARLLTTWDLRSLDQSRFLDLVENCRHPITFAGVHLDHTESGDYAQPNEWVLRAMLESADFSPDFWERASRQFPQPVPPALPAEERTHLQTVHASRHNGTIPFDRYQFNFNETILECDAWSATSLDQALTCPATFALRELFGAVSTADWTPARTEGAAVGNRAHRWLANILGSGNPILQATPARDFERKLAAKFSAARRELSEWYHAEDLPLPIWWETCLRKIEWATRRCLREAVPWLQGKWSAMEQKLVVTVQTPAGSLFLKGRIDLWISDQRDLTNAHVRIFDFKTGRGTAPTIETLKKGDGAQFAAYYLMATDAGVADAVIGIIKPEERAREVFTRADEPELRAHFSLFANLRRNLRFGRRGPLVDDYGVCETLPMATTPIDEAILEQKAGLILLAS